MRKIGIIIRREYLSRVRKKSFIITTLLLPIGMAALMGAIIYFSINSKSVHKIGVIDETSLFYPKMDTTSANYKLSDIKDTITANKQELAEKYNVDILLHIYSKDGKSVDRIVTYTENSMGLKAKSFIDNQINDVYRISLLEIAGMDKMQIDSIEAMSIPIVNQTFEAKQTSSEIASMLGYGMGFLMYMVIFIYGVGVMRGVMEEKTNRIAEVIISSVRPFELMMGKILGIALVGLTQFAMWIGLIIILQFVLLLFMPGLSPESMAMVNVMPNTGAMQAVGEMGSEKQIQKVLALISSQNWFLIIGSFFFYFLGGYLLYAALFAAVGSLVNEDPQDAQQLTMPITLPIVFAFIILATTADDPNSKLAVFGSIFPLTSPIVMIGRIPYNPPAWQIALSMISLIVGFLLTVWLSAKIYRIGILLYGKKVGWKEVIKWLRKA